MNLAAALMGEMPALSKSALRSISSANTPQPARQKASQCYQTRMSNTAARYRALLLASYRDKAFTVNGVRIDENAAGRPAGIRPIQRVVRQLVDEGVVYELRRIPIPDGRTVIYYAFHDSQTPHAELMATADKNFAIQAKFRRKAAAAMLRNWDRAKTGFTHYQAKLYLQSDRYAAHAINDMLAAGELTKTTQSYSRSRQRYIYQLKDAA